MLPSFNSLLLTPKNNKDKSSKYLIPEINTPAITSALFTKQSTTDVRSPILIKIKENIDIDTSIFSVKQNKI